MRISLIADAHNDLLAVGRHIAADNPVRAMTFVAELENCAIRLSELPRAFPLVPRYEQYGIRRHSYRVMASYMPCEATGSSSIASLGRGKITTAPCG